MSERFSPAEEALLDSYVSNMERPVFALRNLPEEVVAVLFAYYSRSESPLRRNLLKLLQDQDLEIVAPGRLPADDGLGTARERARAFHEKWVIGYGHASVAEHGVAHLALEDVSILASKVIEDARLASFTEKSTRYVRFDRNRYLKPPAIMASRYAEDYVETANALFDAYVDLAEPLTEKLRALYPPEPGQRARGYETALKAKACDILRYLLPASTLTNLGITVNGRALGQLISKLLTHPLRELRTIGDAVRQEGETILPTLLKHAGRNEYRAQTRDALDVLAERHFGEVEPRGLSSVTLVRYDPDAELELVAALLYPYVRLPLVQLREHVRTFSREQLRETVDEALRRRGPYDNPIRELEHVCYTFDLLIDFGAYRDIQRHRMATQTTQTLTVEHGYEVPEELELLRMTDRFEDLMDRAATCYRRMAGSLLFEASYIVPMAFRRRVAFTWNLRELIHFIELRSSPQGHRSYRRVAQEIFRQVERVHPFVASYIRVVLDDIGLERLERQK